MLLAKLVTNKKVNTNRGSSMKSFNEIIYDVTKFGRKIKTSDYMGNGKYPIIDQGKNLISGYTNEENGIFVDVPAIIFGDHTRILKYIDTPFFLGADGTKILKAKNENCNLKFIYYALKNIKIPDTGYNRHYKWLKESSIIYPAIEHQDKIVNILDRITSIITLKKQQLVFLEKLKHSLFVEMFGDLKVNNKHWNIVGFKDCATIDTKMVHDFKGYGNYPHIGIDCIEKETGRLLGYRTISEDKVISGKYLFTPNHIIYSKIRPNLNKVAMPEFSGLCSADAYPILVKEGICNREYLGYTLRSRYFLDYILTFSTRTNLPKVNRKQVESFSLPLPPIELQEHFTSLVKNIHKHKSVIQKSLDETQLLFDSLMQKYFG